MTKKITHQLELQSVRGLMVSMLVIAHAWAYLDGPYWFKVLEKLNNGHARVVAFFVLSGFVVSLGFGSKRINLRETGAFYAKRLFRLFPAIWTASLLSLIYLFWFHNLPDLYYTSEWFKERFQEDRMNLTWVFLSFVGLSSFLLPPLWTVTIELLATAAMPLIAAMTKLKWVYYWSITGLLVLYAITVGEKTPYYFGIYIPAFMFGAGINTIPQVFFDKIRNLGSIRWVVLIVSVATCFCARIAMGTDYHDKYEALVESFSALIMFVMIVKSGLEIPFLRNKITVYLGDISYSIYLLHFPILCICAKILNIGGFLPQYSVGQSMIIALITLLFTIPLAALSFRFVEQPGMALGRRVSSYIRSKNVREI